MDWMAAALSRCLHPPATQDTGLTGRGEKLLLLVCCEVPGRQVTLKLADYLSSSAHLLPRRQSVTPDGVRGVPRTRGQFQYSHPILYTCRYMYRYVLAQSHRLVHLGRPLVDALGAAWDAGTQHVAVL